MGATPQLERPVRRARRPSRAAGQPALGRGSLVPLDRSSDERLARRATRGDDQALGAIFERYQQELYRFCLGLLGEPQDAQDALQNTMVKALRALPGEEREIALRPWLYRVAHNEAIDLRRTKRETQTLDGHLLDAHSSVAERAEHRERLEWLFRDLSDLPERQRAVLVMRELSGLGFADIGAALGTSGAVVRQSLYEARRNLEQMDLGRGMRCEAVMRVLSDADGRVSGRREIRAHLRDCTECRRFQDRIDARKKTFAGIAPLPALLGGALLQSALGSTGGSAAGEITAVLGGGAAKSAGTVAAMKAVATVAAVAVIGTVAVDRSSQDHRAAGDRAAAPLSQSSRAAHAVSSTTGRSVSRRRLSPAHGGSAATAPVVTSAPPAALAPHRPSAMATPRRSASREQTVTPAADHPASRPFGELASPVEATNAPPKAEAQAKPAKNAEKSEEKAAKAQVKSEERAAKAEAKAQEKTAKAEAKAQEKTAKAEAKGKPEHPAQEAETTPAPEAEGPSQSTPRQLEGES
jgi:RNA polymerase sigma factor (sigma-70 family)